MHEELQSWIAQTLQRPGIHAFGIRMPDKTCFSHSLVPDFNPAQLDATWENLVDTVSGLNLHRVPACRMTWRFADGQVHFIVRGDGIALGFLTNLPCLEISTADIDRIADDFLALQSLGLAG